MKVTFKRFIWLFLLVLSVISSGLAHKLRIQFQGVRQPPNLTLSVCIPATKRDFEDGRLERLLQSIQNQTHKPDEVIIAISETHSTSMSDLVGRLVRPLEPIRIRLLQSREVLNQAQNRNKAARLSTGDIISFIDADDVMHPLRTEIIRATFQDNPLIDLVLHNCTTANEPEWYSAMYLHRFSGHVVTKDSICDAEKVTRGTQVNLPLAVHHAHNSIRRRVFVDHQYDESYDVYRQEDSVFVRQCVQSICADVRRSMILLLAPLTFYDVYRN